MTGSLFQRTPPASPDPDFRRRYALDTLGQAAPAPARLNRAADEALRHIRRSTGREAGFAWLLSPQMAFGLLLMAVAGGTVGATWPATGSQAASGGGDIVALMVSPAGVPGTGAQ